MELEINKSKNKGFTLVELLVAMAAFSLLVVVIGNIAASVIKGQRKAIAIQNIQDTGRFIMEMVSKELRTSVINTGAGSGLTLLNITNDDSETVNYQFDNTNQRFLRGGAAVSPSNIEVTGGFYVIEYTFPTAPARKVVTIVMKVRSSGGKAEEESEINLQNTIAPRSY